MSRSWTAALALVLLLAQTPAQAHPVPFSYLDIRLQTGAIAGYSATASTMFGGMAGRLQRLQEEMGKK